MKIWMENKAKIEKHNRHFYKVMNYLFSYGGVTYLYLSQGVHTYNLRMNEFGDLLHHEFVATLNGYRQVNSSLERPQGAKYLMPAHTTNLPENVDWREKGAVTPPKNQSCNDCWAFAATSVLESAHHKLTGDLLDLSEQQLVDCVEQNHPDHYDKGEKHPNYNFYYVS